MQEYKAFGQLLAAGASRSDLITKDTEITEAKPDPRKAPSSSFLYLLSLCSLWFKKLRFSTKPRSYTAAYSNRMLR